MFRNGSQSQVKPHTFYSILPVVNSVYTTCIASAYKVVANGTCI